jgi:hypothetical protein
VNIKLEKLVLDCRLSVEVVPLNSQISFFHGQISSGKSSIARLIDFCFGGSYEKTLALEELVTASLYAQIGETRLKLQRNADDKNNVKVTFERIGEGEVSVLAPLVASQTEILAGTDAYNLSDLSFYLSGLKPIKVRKSSSDDSSSAIRLGFRDLLVFSYLRQDRLDSTFFYLDQPVRQSKSRAAIQYILGLYSQKMSEINEELDLVGKQRQTKEDEEKYLGAFLREFSIENEDDLKIALETTKVKLSTARGQISRAREEREAVPHSADLLRDRLRQLSQHMEVLLSARSTIKEKIQEHEELRGGN